MRGGSQATGKPCSSRGAGTFSSSEKKGVSNSFGANRVGDVRPLGCVQQGDGGVRLRGQDVHQRVAVPVQRHAGRRLQQLPVQRAQDAHLRAEHPNFRQPLSATALASHTAMTLNHMLTLSTEDIHGAFRSNASCELPFAEDGVMGLNNMTRTSWQQEAQQGLPRAGRSHST